MDKTKKDITVEMHKLINMCKDKLQNDGKFSPFVVSYSLVTGNQFASIDKWESEEEKGRMLTDVVKWLKEETHPYGIVFGSIVSRKKFENKEDYDKGVNYEVIPGILLIAKMPDKSFHLAVDVVDKKEGKYVFDNERLVDVTNNKQPNFLDEVFKEMN